MEKRRKVKLMEMRLVMLSKWLLRLVVLRSRHPLHLLRSPRKSLGPLSPVASEKIKASWGQAKSRALLSQPWDHLLGKACLHLLQLQEQHRTPQLATAEAVEAEVVEAEVVEGGRRCRTLGQMLPRVQQTKVVMQPIMTNAGDSGSDHSSEIGPHSRRGIVSRNLTVHSQTGQTAEDRPAQAKAAKVVKVVALLAVEVVEAVDEHEFSRCC
mmetsp:Transcript_84097/g.146294  ORF Transcript_84097/g.146294 Transcript_84097/m.146294 type:complete len:211 (+) Transcript_84097:412-1044(+)